MFTIYKHCSFSKIHEGIVLSIWQLSKKKINFFYQLPTDKPKYNGWYYKGMLGIYRVSCKIPSYPAQHCMAFNSVTLILNLQVL